MNLFGETLKQTCTNYKEPELFEGLQSTYRDLIKRKVLRIDYPNDTNLCHIERLKLNCKVYNQALLHRAILLFEASLRALSDRNVYAIALCIRGHYETTAALGYIHKRCVGFLNQERSFDEFNHDTFVQMLSWKETSKPPQSPDPIQILTQLDYADKVVYSKLLKPHGNYKEILRENYEFLCNFAHPNFHSNMAAYRYDKESKAIILRYDDPLRNEEFFISRLKISNDIFVWLFDEFRECIERIK
jgi:hypothetical protein